jgi:secreted Zn-dependent insulinase-like peptidase
VFSEVFFFFLLPCFVLFLITSVHREPDKILSAEVTRNWSEISYGRFQFDRIQREAAALLEVTKEDLLEFWDKYFAAVSLIM